MSFFDYMKRRNFKGILTWFACTRWTNFRDNEAQVLSRFMQRPLINERAGRANVVNHNE